MYVMQTPLVKKSFDEEISRIKRECMSLSFGTGNDSVRRRMREGLRKKILPNRYKHLVIRTPSHLEKYFFYILLCVDL